MRLSFDDFNCLNLFMAKNPTLICTNTFEQRGKLFANFTKKSTFTFTHNSSQ